MINNTMYLTGGKSPNPLSPPTNLAAKAGNAQVTLTWTDPPNATSEPSGQTIATWAYTLIVRKQGSQPTGPGDGTLVVKSSVRDQYQTTGYIDTNLTNDTLYYYGAFAYNSDGVYSEGAFVSATPRLGTPVGELTPGTIITITESGAPIEFYISGQNYQSDLNGIDQKTLLVRKECFDNRPWNNPALNTYATSTLDSWLNREYKSTLSANVQNLIGTTKFYYTPGNNNNIVSVLERSVFSVSFTEIGKTSSYVNTEGSVLPIASTLQKATLNGEANTQWTRSPYIDSGTTDMAFGLFADGLNASTTCTANFGSRPAFCLPSYDAFVNSSNALIES